MGYAKYKGLDVAGFRHADIYQMLAYCTASGLASGLLVYAAGEAESGVHRVRNAGKTIEVASLDLEGTPEMILSEVGKYRGVGAEHGGDRGSSVRRSGQVRPGAGFRTVMLGQRLENPFRHDHLPGIAAKPVPVFRFGTFPVPSGDGQDRREGETHTGRKLKTPGHLSHHRSFLIQEFPTVWSRPYL